MKNSDNRYGGAMKIKLIPPDINQCQVEKPNGNTFMTFGGTPKLVRCTNQPTVVVYEKRKRDDGLKGSMSMCSTCLEMFYKQMPPSLEIDY